ncbi:hypothetical protein FF38_01341 [Lucilia cuprina]|uniref:Uncharacterized protein n=1 Tax=Lucilia cuprina TaxID=7375 RepID=A0A0L0C327_LUCCU|nr:hypothetical protein FF38_01341 [Lucilia cuprina]
MHLFATPRYNVSEHITFSFRGSPESESERSSPLDSEKKALATLCDAGKGADKSSSDDFRVFNFFTIRFGGAGLCSPDPDVLDFALSFGFVPSSSDDEVLVIICCLLVVSSTSESEIDEDDFDIEHVDDSVEDDESSLVAFAKPLALLPVFREALLRAVAVAAFVVEAGFLLISFLAVNVGPLADAEADDAELMFPLWLGVVLRGLPRPFLGPATTPLVIPLVVQLDAGLTKRFVKSSGSSSLVSVATVALVCCFITEFNICVFCTIGGERGKAVIAAGTPGICSVPVGPLTGNLSSSLVLVSEDRFDKPSMTSPL